MQRIVAMAIMGFMCLCFLGCTTKAGSDYQGTESGYYYSTGDYGDLTYHHQGPVFGAHSPGTTEWHKARPNTANTTKKSE